ncbi:pyocin knob domain-containing protein [Capnocytophaga sp.]|uniref:pyocin knob domain-containing protein n=1 Tax=Capnocytophaga sp. TaxID=44737 RepID=UPI0026DD622B|nr:pyocin knob domain-containing protein [Capnocytophaga sp.]MDO5106589.1 pyocin knob domain-containing protein [Capnocytophaga sp.]
MATREQLKNWFSELKKPNQSQFWAWLDSFIHKEDKIPMDAVEGLDKALQDTASDTQFQAHLTDNEAHSDLFAQKVDKEDGKGLSTNDYSDEEKQKVHNSADKTVVNLTITGDVDKIATITFADGTSIKASFRDLGVENVADIMLNSLNFNHETGVLTGLRSDGQQLTVNLDGRYSLLTHTHSYNDLEDLPTLLPEAPNDGKAYNRKNGGWVIVTNPFDFEGSTELGNVNLNTITQPGVYRQDRGAYANKANNYPANNIRGGSLYVLPVSSPDASNIFHQLFVSGGTTNTGTNTAYYYEVPRVFLRKYVRGGKWVGWFELSSTKRILSQSANAFTTDDQIEELSQYEATVLLPDSEVTITINKGKRTHITYVQTAEKTVTLTAQDGLTLIGKTSFEGKIGQEIKIVLAENTAYVSGGEADFPEAPTDGKEYLRQNKTWKAFTGWQFKELGTENLNNIKTAGFYGKYNSSEATVARNYPYDAIRGGHLFVLPMTTNASTLTVFQVYFAAGTQNSGDYTNSARIFMRAFVNNSKWLPWREFDGGKIHNLTETAQNLASAFQSKFPTSGSTFVVNQATTITVANTTQVVTYVKNTAENLTFTPTSGVGIIGDKVVTAPIGTLVHLVCNGATAFVCYAKENTPANSNNNILVFSATRSTLNLDKTHAGKTIVVTDMTRNITLDTSNFPDNAECSIIKLTDNYHINITPSPSKGFPIKGKAMSSAYLLKVGGSVYIKNDEIFL